MKLHDYSPASFSPMRLIPEGVVDHLADLPFSETLFEDPARQLKLRSRQITAGALRLLRDRGIEHELADVDLRSLIEHLADTLIHGVETPMPLSTALMQSLKSQATVENIHTWREATNAIADAAEFELSAEHALVVADRCDAVQRFLDRLMISLTLKTFIADAA